jgi:hypothetical protein
VRRRCSCRCGAGSAGERWDNDADGSVSGKLCSCCYRCAGIRASVPRRGCVTYESPRASLWRRAVAAGVPSNRRCRHAFCPPVCCCLKRRSMPGGNAQPADEWHCRAVARLLTPAPERCLRGECCSCWLWRRSSATRRLATHSQPLGTRL